MTGPLDWIAGHGHTLIVATIAFLAGIATMLPTGVTLPDSAAALIGAVLGSVATIGGALLLWRVQEAQRTRHLAKSIAMQFGDVFHGSLELISQLGVADQKQGSECTFCRLERSKSFAARIAWAPPEFRSVRPIA